MAKNKTLLSVSILFIGITIGLLGELMPDEIKSSFQGFCCQYLHTDSVTVWWVLIGLMIALFLYLSLKQEQTTPPPPTPTIEIKDSKNINTGKVNTSGGDFRLGDN
jgi:hypothetical protein